MKSVTQALLLTSALSAVVANAAFAEAPAVTVGGTIVTQYGHSNQEGKFTNQHTVSTVNLRDTSDQHIRTDSRVAINVAGKAENGLGYGGVISLVANASGKADEDFTQQTSDKTYIFVETDQLGRAEVGTNAGASLAMKVNAATLARASGGINGDFYKFVNLGAVVSSANAIQQQKFIVTPDLPSVSVPGARSRAHSSSALSDSDHTLTDAANKVTYYTPRFSGFQAGVSYAPNLGEAGNANGFQGKYNSNAKYNQDVFTAGLNYDGEYREVKIKASAVGETGGKAQKASAASTVVQDELKAYELGANLSYAGVTVGGSWAAIPEFGRPKSQHDEAGFWTLGAAYEYGPAAISVTYLDSRAEQDAASNALKNKFQNVSVGADYKLAPGLTPYVEASFFDMTDSDATTTDNEGSVLLVGTMLSF